MSKKVKPTHDESLIYDSVHFDWTRNCMQFIFFFFFDAYFISNLFMILLIANFQSTSTLTPCESTKMAYSNSYIWVWVIDWKIKKKKQVIRNAMRLHSRTSTLAEYWLTVTRHFNGKRLVSPSGREKQMKRKAEEFFCQSSVF